MARRFSLVAVLVPLLLALTACGGGPVKRVFPPEVRVQELRLGVDDATLLLRVQSFSTVPSTVERYALTLEIAGSTAAVLQGDAAMVVLPRAAEALPMTAVLDPAAVAQARESLARGTALRYRVHGTITVEPHGRAYPIDYASALSPVPGIDGVLR